MTSSHDMNVLSAIAGKYFTTIRLFLVGGLLLVLGSGLARSEEPLQNVTALQSYFDQIGNAQDELDAGKISDATGTLERTDEHLRDFEYNYLVARLVSATEGTPAPDLVQEITSPETESRYALFNETSRDVVFICRDGSIHIHNTMTTGAEAKIIANEDAGAIWAGDFSHDGSRFFTGHARGEVIVYDANNWEILHRVDIGAGAPVRELAAGPSGSMFVAESKDGLELWSLTGGEPSKVAIVGERYRFGEGLSVSPDGTRLATGGMFDINFHDSVTGKKLNSISHASYTMGLQYSPDGNLIASAPRGNVNKCLAVFEVNSEEKIFNVTGFADYVLGMAFTPTNKRLAVTSCGNKLRIFDTSTGKIALSITRPECGSKIAFARDGQTLGWSEPSGFSFINLETNGD